MRSALEQLQELGFDEEAFEAIQEGLGDYQTEEENAAEYKAYHDRLEMRLRTLLKVIEEQGVPSRGGRKASWLEMAQMTAMADVTLN